MKKYYIYLNGKQYMEMPEAYGIKHDVYMNYNDLIDRYFKDRNLYARAIPLTKKIEILSKFINKPQNIDNIIRHELTHIKQIQETPNYSLQYSRALKKYGYGGSPYEVEAKQWASKKIPLHRVGTFDIDYQKQLERWQKKSPEIFASAKQKMTPQEQKITDVAKLAIQGKYKKDYLTKDAVELTKKRLSKFLK